MKKNKVVIMSLLMLLPLGIIFVISNFGRNNYNLPVFFAEDSMLTDKGAYEVTEAHTIPPFQLTDHLGKVITQEQLKGTIYVADFFFTRCGSICPNMSMQLTRVQEEFLAIDDVKLVSFTVDPENDTVEVLNAYAKEYGAVYDKWRFATGTKEDIYLLAQKGFYISAMEDTMNPVEFIHSEKLILVDKNGWIRGYFNGTDSKEVDKLITEIKVLRRIYEDKSTN